MTGVLGTSSVNLDDITCDEVSDPAVMNKHPLVSVQMITYNHRPYIAQAIEGVLMQKTDFPVELVVGEDCSTDGTREIVLRYQRRYPETIRVITSAKNVGARKNALRTAGACRGKYMAFCEGDDYWYHPQKLQMQVDYLEAHPNVGLVHSGADTYDVVTKRRKPWVLPSADYDSGDIFLKLLSRRYLIYTATVCARRELMLKVKRENPDSFDPKYLMGDLPLWLELSRVAKVKLLNEALVCYRVLPESASRSGGLEKPVRFIKSGAALRMHFVKKYNCSREVANTVLAGAASALLWFACVHTDADLAVEARNDLMATTGYLQLKQRVHFFCATNGLGRLIVRRIGKPLAGLKRRLIP